MIAFKEMADAAAIDELTRRPVRLDDPESYADAISLAWEHSQRNGLSWGLSKWLAWRSIWKPQFSMFGESARSITSTHRFYNRRLNDGPRRRAIAPHRFLDTSADPAHDAGFRIDFREWWSNHVSERQRTIANLCNEGHSHREIAERLNVSRQLVQLETEKMRASWRHFVSLTETARTEGGAA